MLTSAAHKDLVPCSICWVSRTGTCTAWSMHHRMLTLMQLCNLLREQPALIAGVMGIYWVSVSRRMNARVVGRRVVAVEIKDQSHHSRRAYPVQGMTRQACVLKQRQVCHLKRTLSLWARPSWSLFLLMRWTDFDVPF